MNPGAPRTLLRSVGIFLVVFGLGACPWPRVAPAFSAAYCPMANLVLDAHTFGNRGHARLVPLLEIKRQTSDSVTADAVLSFAVEGFSGALPLGVSLRRDVYLPLLLLLALIVSFPLRARRCMICLGVGIPITLGAGVAANCLVAAWTFLTQLKGVYPPSPVTRGIADLSYRALLQPPGNRFIAPIALGAVLLAWQVLCGQRVENPTANRGSGGAAGGQGPAPAIHQD
jgi:hypothetical protein